MSNPSAGSLSGGGAGFQLQADVTGLTEFLLNIGIAGFKHHAQAGVDTHTILSMLAIAEVCPASMQCRMRLSQRRNEQREQSVWLYKIVEVGARVNFIVDQLLRTRAGENIMAMLSGLAPLLSKTAFNTAILYVFQKRNAPSHSVPGLAQLEKFRDIVLPLASVMDIKDKVFQYHKWILQQVSSAANTQSSHTAIPDPETVANVICYLAKIMEEGGEALVLVYHGLLGAAWVAAYAQDILGLPVCMFVTENLTVPFSGDSVSARVILRLCSGKQTCELRRVGNVEDFIKIENVSAREEKRWSVDVRTTRYYSSQRSTSKGSLDHVYSILARSMTSEYVRALAYSLNRGVSDEQWFGMMRFAVARLPLLRKRAFANMQMLGFDCAADRAQKTGWRLFITCHTGKCQRLAASTLWADTFGFALLDSDQYDPSPDPDTIKIDFNTDGQKAIDFLMKAVNFAATLAFTDWGRTFCGMSTRYLDTSWKESWLSEESRPLPYRDPQSIEWRDPTLEMLLNRRPNRFTTTDILRYAIYISTDTDEDLVMKRFLDPANDLIAISCEGLVVARTMSMPDVGALQRIDLLSFYPGSIVCEGERLTSIKSESPRLENSAELVIEKLDTISPWNAVRDLKVVSRSLIERQEVSVETQIMLGAECCQLADAVAISEMIPQLLVSSSCKHDYREFYKIPQRVKSISKEGKAVYLTVPVWQGGLSFQSKNRPEAKRARPASMKVYVQNVDQNPQGQWVACQWTSDWDPFAMILQEDSCLKCISESLELLSLAEVCIINGGTGRKPLSSSKSQLRAPNHDQDHHDSAHFRPPSGTEQDARAMRRNSLVGDHGDRKKAEDQSVHSQSQPSLDLMGIPVAEEPSKSKWAKFGWPKRKNSTQS